MTEIPPAFAHKTPAVSVKRDDGLLIFRLVIAPHLADGFTFALKTVAKPAYVSRKLLGVTFDHGGAAQKGLDFALGHAWLRKIRLRPAGGSIRETGERNVSRLRVPRQPAKHKGSEFILTGLPFRQVHSLQALDRLLEAAIRGPRHHSCGPGGFSRDRVDEDHVEATGVEDLEDGNPVDARGFHRHLGHATRREPVSEAVQIGRKGGNDSDGGGIMVRWHGDKMFRRPTVDAGGVRMETLEGMGRRARRW
jgi:hypothetical protein